MSWRNYFKELIKDLIKYIKRDRSKDNKLVGRNNSNIIYTPHEIIE